MLFVLTFLHPFTRYSRNIYNNYIILFLITTLQSKCLIAAYNYFFIFSAAPDAFRHNSVRAVLSSVRTQVDHIIISMAIIYGLGDPYQNCLVSFLYCTD